MKTKMCTKCNKEFPATTNYFYRSRKVKDGLFAACKKCELARQKFNRDLKSDHEEKECKLLEVERKFKRYINGVIDIVMCYRKNKLYKTMSFLAFEQKYPDIKLETLVIN